MKRHIYLLTVLAFGLGCAGGHQKPRPEYLVLEKEPYSLFFYGAVHSNDPEDPMFEDIDSQFVRHRPNIVLVEGGFNQQGYNTREEAIKDGEAAYAGFLAKNAGCEVDDIEPPDSFVIAALREKHEAKSILTMYLLRQVYQLQREAKYKEIDFENYAVHFVRVYIRKGIDVPNITTFHDVQKFVLDETKPGITADNWKKINVFDVVYKPGNKINRIYKEVLKMRDGYAVELIIAKIREYKRVFVIMGGDHIKNQAGQLKREFQMFNGI